MLIEMISRAKHTGFFSSHLGSGPEGICAWAHGVVHFKHKLYHWALQKPLDLLPLDCMLSVKKKTFLLFSSSEVASCSSSLHPFFLRVLGSQILKGFLYNVLMVQPCWEYWKLVKNFRGTSSPPLNVYFRKLLIESEWLCRKLFQILQLSSISAFCSLRPMTKEV